MPLYEYLCGTCDKTTEQLVLAGDIAATPVCTSCGSQDVKRLLSRFAAQADSAGRGASSFDASTACGGGACRMPDVCGAGAGGDDF